MRPSSQTRAAGRRLEQCVSRDQSAAASKRRGGRAHTQRSPTAKACWLRLPFGASVMLAALAIQNPSRLWQREVVMRLRTNSRDRQLSRCGQEPARGGWRSSAWGRTFVFKTSGLFTAPTAVLNGRAFQCFAGAAEIESLSLAGSALQMPGSADLSGSLTSGSPSAAEQLPSRMPRSRSWSQ